MSRTLYLVSVFLGLCSYIFLLLASALDIETDKIVFATSSIILLYYGTEGIREDEWKKKLI